MSNSSYIIDLNIPKGITTDDASSKPMKTPEEIPAPAQSGKSKRWTFIQTDLKSAIDTWQELEKAEIAPSHEEEQMAKIKSIIGQLREKLQQF